MGKRAAPPFLRWEHRGAESSNHAPKASEGCKPEAFRAPSAKGCFRVKSAGDPLWQNCASSENSSRGRGNGGLARGGVGKLAGGMLSPLVARERETPVKATELFHLSCGERVKNENQPKCATTRDCLSQPIYITPCKRPLKLVSQDSE